MRLKHIRLVGFKSFADETVIELQDAITCIVGPNGCGKSNILDALRWVLGEKSARGLRGQQMEDLIFLGSRLRKAAGMAEVEVCFDNRDRTLAIGQDELIVGRRLYVSRTSEYYLNGKHTTRRELEKIFLDTGIGKSAYSILEQGKISEILRATPEARRSLLDEAAGIARFKLERQETLQRLRETEQNLLRLNDIWKAKRRDIENLEKQAYKTRRYLQLKKESEKHDRRLRYLNIRQLYEKCKNAEDQLRVLVQKREQSLSQTRELETQRQKMDKANRSQLEEAHSLDRSHHRDITAVASLKKRQKRIAEEQQERRLRIQALEKRFREERRKHELLEKRLNEALQLQLNLETDLGKLKSKSRDTQADIQRHQNEVQDSLRQEERNEADLQQKEKEHEQLLKELKDVAHELILELEQKKEELKSRENIRNELKENIQKKLQANSEALREAIDSLNKNEPELSLQKLKAIQKETLLEDFQRYDSIQQIFRSLLFDPSGLLARKESLDQKMATLAQTMDELKKGLRQQQEERKKLLELIEEKKNNKQEIDLGIRDHEVRKEAHKESHESIRHQAKESQDRLHYFDQEKGSQKKYLEELYKEEKASLQELSSLEGRMHAQAAGLKHLQLQIDKHSRQIEKLDQQIRQTREGLEAILPQLSNQERSAEQSQMQLRQNEEELYNDFQLKFTQLEAESAGLHIDRKKEETSFRRFQKEIQELGSFNALAIEELEKNQAALKVLEEQRSDIEEARTNIFNAVREMDQKSLKIFRENLSSVEEKFAQVFSKLFGGGHAQLKLTDSNDILNSGIDIMAQPPGKKNTSIALLSGGEQGMTAIALIFALYLVRPSPFCFLDEIDAPLDDANVRRFLTMLTEYTPNTQFLIITHNKLTMAYAEAIFGVTQEEAGVSQLVSVRLVEGEQRQTA